MRSEARQPLEHVVRHALSLPLAERAAFLDEASSGDDDLRRRLESLMSDEERRSGGGAGPLGTDDASRANEPPLPAGHVIGGYRLEGRLGRGAMGEVYRAEDTRLGRKVALKVLPSRLTGEPQRVTRFQREARAASALNHPSILTIHDFGEHDGRHYIASELVEGRTLRELMREGPADLALAVDAVTQVAHALAAAHEAGIVHRDIKPENVMLRPDGFVKLLDFGLAKLTAPDAPADEAQPGRVSPSAFETQAGSVLGTVSYMSPEQAAGQAVDARSDLFSLGVVLYELVAGHRPFEGDTASGVIEAILKREPPPLAVHAKATPVSLQRIVDRALAKAREQRYATARELLSDLQRLKQELDRHDRSLRRFHGRARADVARGGHSAALEERAGPDRAFALRVRSLCAGGGGAVRAVERRAPAAGRGRRPALVSAVRSDANDERHRHGRRARRLHLARR